MLMKTMIIDDEPAICSELEYLLGKHIEIQVSGIYCNALEALPAVLETEPDLLFLDIRMPGMSGMEFARRLQGMARPPLIIFSTAYHEYALEAFSTPAVGYLTKPIEEEKLNEAIQKVKTLLKNRQHNAYGQTAPFSEQIVVHRKGKLVPVQTRDIVFAQMKDKILYIALKDSIDKSDMTMQDMEMLLGRVGHFFRCHRNYIVNVNEINEIIPWFNNTYLLKMNNSGQTEIPVSRGKVKAFRNLMNL